MADLFECFDLSAVPVRRISNLLPVGRPDYELVHKPMNLAARFSLALPISVKLLLENLRTIYHKAGTTWLARLQCPSNGASSSVSLAVPAERVAYVPVAL